MNEKNLSILKRIVYGLIVLFILIFVNGFLDLGGKSLLAIDLLYLMLGIVLIVLIFKSEVEGKLKKFLLLIGFSSVGFSLGLVYGILGIWGFYDINDPIYLTLVIASWIGFMIGVIGSIVLFKKNGGRQLSPS